MSPERLSRRSVLQLSALTASLGFLSLSEAASGGEYRGRIVTEWDPDGRTMIVQTPFEYVDSSGRKWPVPAGVKVDGASIPQVFWSIIGGPFEGQYRAASVIHDHYCNTRTRRASDVHKVFHDGMLTSGVADKRAWMMWKAVDQFGPRWNDPKIDPRCEIVDENYDFKLCARNSAPPARVQPSIDRGELERFVGSIAADADSADIDQLKRAIQKAR